MALIKTKTLPTGFTAEYWRVIGANVTINGGTFLTVQIALYKDKAKFLAGGSAIDVVGLQLTSKLPATQAKNFKDWIWDEDKKY